MKQSFFIIAQNFRIQTDKLRNIIIEEPFFCLPLMCFLLLYSIYQPVGESIIIYDYDIMTIDKEVNAVSASEDICQFGNAESAYETFLLGFQFAEPDFG